VAVCCRRDLPRGGVNALSSVLALVTIASYLCTGHEQV
jgi:hypothetical protein